MFGKGPVIIRKSLELDLINESQTVSRNDVLKLKAVLKYNMITSFHENPEVLFAGAGHIHVGVTQVVVSWYHNNKVEGSPPGGPSNADLIFTLNDSISYCARKL